MSGQIAQNPQLQLLLYVPLDTLQSGTPFFPRGKGSTGRLCGTAKRQYDTHVFHARPELGWNAMKSVEYSGSWRGNNEHFTWAFLPVHRHLGPVFVCHWWNPRFCAVVSVSTASFTHNKRPRPKDPIASALFRALHVGDEQEPLTPNPLGEIACTETS